MLGMDEKLNPHFLVDVITYPCPDASIGLAVSKTGPWVETGFKTSSAVPIRLQLGNANDFRVNCVEKTVCKYV